MSLNGLDSVTVTEAHQAALSEAGGWFLLKYITRDEVDLLRAGNGGVAELRDAIANYEEKSPLYGFIQYRRRKVLLKYIPDGTSRLLQARVSVHFHSILDKFTPHDAVFPLSTFSDLKETSLSSACSLHTASASIKSSNSSLRRKKLAEITEDAAETQPPGTPSVNVDQQHDNKEHGAAEDELKELKTSSANTDSNHQLPRKQDPSPPIPPPKHYSFDKPLPEFPTGLEHEEIEDRTSDNTLDDPIRSSEDRRQSSQSLRPATRDLNGAYTYKPKVKFGPRPSLDMTGRPRTSNFYSRPNEPRPVSSLPAGIHVPIRRSSPTQPQSQETKLVSTDADETEAPPVLTSPPQMFHQGLGRPSSRAGSVNDVYRYVSIPETRTPKITPEKQRLMRALQLRQKQMGKKNSELRPPAETVVIPSPENASGDSSKQDQHEVPFNSIEDTSVVEGDSDVVRVDMKDLHDDALVNLEASPISIPEPSEGPSTQASSIADTDDGAAKQIQMAVETSAPSEHNQSLQLSNPEEEGEPRTFSEDADPSLPNSNVLGSRPEQMVNVLPEEVPLPPIGEGEEEILSLARHGKSFGDNKSSPPLNITEETAHPPPLAKLQTELNNKAEDADRSAPPINEKGDSRGKKRKIRKPSLVDPIDTTVVENNDDDFSSDDSFMEELQSATVQEAKPISVSRSPIRSFFPRSLIERPSSESVKQMRSVSNPVENGTVPDKRHLSTSAASIRQTRSFSASPAPNLTPEHLPAALIKKGSVSSGISQRIKALEKLSSRESSPSAQQHSSPITPTLAPSLDRKLTPPPASKDTGSLGSKFRRKFSQISPSPAATVNPPSPMASTITLETSAKPAKPVPESISITATIVRDSNNQRLKAPFNPSQPDPTKLHRSPLVVQHQTVSASPSISHEQPPKPSSKTRSERSSSPSSKEPRRNSFTIFGRESFTNVRRESFASRRSTSSRKEGEVDVQSLNSDTSSSGGFGPDGTKKDKESRRSRLFKRMSSITSASRRSLVHALSPTLREEEPIMEQQEPIPEVALSIVDLGDVNVQFPDTLLWKRRDLKIDGQGYLILSPSKADNNSKIATRQFHLSEFRPAYVPDQDRQEMPNSVILDFKDGSTLQCACENPNGQRLILKALLEAHQAYH